MQKQPQQIQRWHLEGRFSFVSEKASGTVTLRWTQDQARYLMHFIAPLGQGTHILRGGEDDGVYLLTAKNKVFHAESAETLLQQFSGLSIPIGSFKYWVRGLPDPRLELADQRLDGQDRVIAMQQGPWRVGIKRYMDVDGLDLPAKIFMDDDHLKLKLIIRTWELDP